MLVILSGLPGTGKTTVSKALAKELGGCVLSTDKIRKGAIETQGYTKRRKRRVYEEMFRMARESLAKSENVILDATFFKKN